MRSVPHGRLLFIRRPDRQRAGRSSSRLTATSRPGATTVTKTELEAYDDLRELDLLGGKPAGHPLFLVCTHGKHDPCCARYGRPLYEALRDELEPDRVWQVSHVGGDRFAGNLVCLPEGLYYGRVDRETAGSVLDEHLARRIHDGELPRAVDLRVRGPGGRARRPRADGSRRDRRPRPSSEWSRRNGSIRVLFAAGGANTRGARRRARPAT